MIINKMKTVDINTLEQIIAKAISESVGVELNCHINNIDYNNNSGYHGAQFNVSLSEPIEKLFGFNFAPANSSDSEVSEKRQ